MKDVDKILDLIDYGSEYGSLPYAGLCSCLESTNLKLLRVFSPSYVEDIMMTKDGLSPSYWASGLRRWHLHEASGFTTLRQTILAFLLVIEEDDFNEI